MHRSRVASTADRPDRPQPRVPAEHHVQQRGAAFFPEYVVAPVEHRAHHRLAVVKGCTHARPLAGLSGKHEGHGRRPPRCRHVLRFRDCPQALAQRFRVPECHARPIAEVASADACRPGHVGQQGIGRRTFGPKLRVLLIEPSEIAARQIAQRRAGLSGEREQARGARRKPVFRLWRRSGRWQ